MNLKEMRECERTKIEKWSSFQLANAWKLRGTVICLLIFGTMIALKFTDSEPLWLKDVLRKCLLIGLLIVTLSKEKIEDEMVTTLRFKAYTLAFIMAVVYSLIQPLADYVVNNFILEANKDNDFSYFQVLSFMLIIQIMFFEILKRNR
ncbi:hypothetical protein [Winogradskyella sp. A3E31]|uniref:hypothetical protein n=1 Tax=Winogradskyella sp. A3E31 TaxID=3349637 RepID=UPI00398AD718